MFKNCSQGEFSMKRLSLCLALICLLAGSLGAVQDQAPKDYVWRLLSSELYESWYDSMGPDGENWESSHYYYSASDPLQLDSLKTGGLLTRYYYYTYPDYTQKEALSFSLPNYSPVSRTLETYHLNGLLWKSEYIGWYAPGSQISNMKEYSYDQSGNMIEEWYYSGNTGNLALFQLTKINYRSDNQPLREVQYRVGNSCPDSLELYKSISRVYNDNALVLESYSNSQGNWRRSSYSYNGDKLPVTEATFSSQDSLSWIPIDETTTSYSLLNGVYKPYQLSRDVYSTYDSTWHFYSTETHSYSNDLLQEWVKTSYSNTSRERTIVYNSGMLVVSDYDQYGGEGYSSSSYLNNVWDLVSVQEDPQLPGPDLKLSAYPNPFNPRTTIHYELKNSGKVVLDLYNLRGQRVKRLVDTVQEPGAQTVELLLNSSELGSGVYFLRLEAGGSTESTKILLLK